MTDTTTSQAPPEAAPSARPTARGRRVSPCGSVASRLSTGSTSQLAPRRDRGADRPERRRQDHVLQLPHRAVSTDGGRGPVPRPQTARRSPQVGDQAGMARTFQNIRLFANMTALENVMVGRYCRTSAGPISAIVRGPKFRREERETRERASELLDVRRAQSQRRPPGPQPALRRPAPAGDRPRAGHRPRLLLLDEPTAGMNPQETRQAEELIFRIRELGPRRRGHRARHAVHLQPVRPGRSVLSADRS